LTIELVITSILLGVGLAMDAFSVSLADGLGEKNLNAARVLTIAGTFAAFQFLMPVAGWLLVHTAAEKFTAFQKFIPWIALLLLLYIGGKMLIEGIQENRSTSGRDMADPGESDETDPGKAGSSHLSAGDLMVQGVATSIDALSVGFTIASYTAAKALTTAAIIGVVTLFICIAGLYLGRQIGTRLAGKASVFGGVILILIGIEIWARGLFF
jgi:putative Mn2+ efflux pump MntP